MRRVLAKFSVLFALSATSALPAAADDRSTCFGAPTSGRTAACSRLIESQKLRGGDLTRTYLQRGLSYTLLEGDYDRALSDFNEVLRLEPNNVIAHCIRGAIFTRKGSYDRALVDLNAARRLAPHDQTVHNAFGFYYNATGDHDRALVELNEAIRIRPQFLYAYKNRGISYEKKGELALALADFRMALSIDPEKKETGGKDAAQGIERVEKKLSAAREAKPAAASPPTQNPSPVPTALAANLGRRVALVIGNSAYRNATLLANPANDAADMADALRNLGFEVVEGRDLDWRQMIDKVRDFSRRLERADLAIAFYAGHGVQVAGRNYLVPIDAKLDKAGDLELDTVDVQAILRPMEAERRANLLFLDACRDNPFTRSLARSLGSRSAAVGPGLAAIQTGAGTLISFATQPDNVALDGEGRNSPFTTALLKHMRAPGLEVEQMMKRVRLDVLEATRGKQVPRIDSGLVGDVYLSSKAN